MAAWGQAMQLRDRSDVIQRLRERIPGMLSISERSGISTGYPDLDRMLADGGLRRGTLVEWLSDAPGSGAATLALSVAAQILREEGALVAIDPAGEFYPVAAADLGIPLERTVIVQPPVGQASNLPLWAWEQSLRCPGVAVTFGRIGNLDGRLFRRLQLAVEAGEGLGFLVRPAASRAGASWAATCIRVCPVPPSPLRRGGLGGRGFARRLRVSVTRGHSGTRATEIELELPHETDDVPLVPELAGAMADGYAAVG
jgi:protein ImuA